MPYEFGVTRLLSVLLASACAVAAPPPGMTCSGAICVDAASGKVLAENNADTPGLPASVAKLMTVLLALEDVDAGQARLADLVAVAPAATRFGGSTVALAAGEKQTLDDLIAATLLRSANDAAAAIACARAPTLPAFIERMNTRAAALGMLRTRFVSPNGLTYGNGPHDITTARDLATLCRELLRHPKALTYTSSRNRTFRPFSVTDRVEMANHNRLLASYPGCDGFKTGWTVAAGASIATTAVRDGRRVIAVVLSAQSPQGAKPEQRLRDAYAAQLMDEGFAAAARLNLPKANTPAAAIGTPKVTPAQASPTPSAPAKPATPPAPLFNPKPSR